MARPRTRKIIWRGEKLRVKALAEIDRRLEKVGKMMVDSAQQSLSQGSSKGGGPSPPGAPPYQFRGRLSKSVKFSLRKRRKVRVVRVGTKHLYGWKQEVGGTITPKSSTSLAVPISQQAKRHRGSARDFPKKLTLIRRQNKPPLLVDTSKERFTKRGNARKNSRFDIHYVLPRRVTLPPRPWLRPTLEKHRRKALRILTKGSIFRRSRGIKAINTGELSAMETM